MAKCIECHKRWNSWGDGDDFCSDNCEEAFKQKARQIIQESMPNIPYDVKLKLKKVLETEHGWRMLNDELKSAQEITKTIPAEYIKESPST